MALVGKGVAAIWHDIAPEDEPDYHHWHCHEHIPERVSVPGFLRGRRFVSEAASPRFFHFYETTNLETLTSPAYLARLDDPTPWTQRVIPNFRNTNRTLSNVVASHGLGLGAAILTLCVSTTVQSEAQFEDWASNSLFPALVKGPGIVGAHLLRGDQAASHTKTKEKAMRDRLDDVADWVVLIEAIDRSYLDTLRQADLSDASLKTKGASSTQNGIYQLHFVLSENECQQKNEVR